MQPFSIDGNKYHKQGFQFSVVTQKVSKVELLEILAAQ